MDLLLVAVVGLALFFDFTNGFHDSANAIATSVATRAVSPKVAVVAAAVLNFLGAFVSLKVAATIAKGIVTPEIITLHVVLAGIIAAIMWNLLTWRVGLPTSSSHALIGGIAGSAIVASGWQVIQWHGLESKVLIPSLAASGFGLAIAGGVMLIILRITRGRTSQGINQTFQRMQLVTGGFVAFAHGTNDAQKTMGIIALALLSGHPHANFHVPLWVVIASASAMAFGTYVGGWRIVQTLGSKLVKLEPPQGFAAELSTAGILGLTAHFGFPVSTTHTISSSIMGAGVASGRSKISWKVAGDILLAWIITIPCAAVMGALTEGIVHIPSGSIIVCVFAVVSIATFWLTRHWTWESTAQVRARLNLIQKIRS